MTPCPFVPKPTTTQETFLQEFWSHIISQAEQYQSDFKDGQLPHARIKKLVKSDSDIKMIANEVTVLLDKACEIFINELIVRSFLVANSSNRRTVNLSDVALAVSQSDMFDFLIDIVPNEQLVPTEDNEPSTSTLPTASSSKQKQSTNSRGLNPFDHPQVQSECSTTQSFDTTTTLPTAVKKKKIKKNKVNRNLLPEEIAVPIGDEELIQRQDSNHHHLHSGKRLLAIPIPDSELIPPRSSHPSWEMAVPITNSNHSFLSSNIISNSNQSRSWELAVPITDVNSTSLNPQISNHNALNNNLSIKRKRNWDLAVPIIDKNDSETLVKIEEGSDDHKLRSPSPSSSSSLSHFNNQPQSSQKRTWELAVPITSEEQAVGPSNNTNHNLDFIQHDQSNFILNQNLHQVPIDPALFLLDTTAVKIEPDPVLQLSNPVTCHHLHSNDNFKIKQEE